MRTAVSIPDDVFADAEKLAKKLGTSRSRLYSVALREFVARYSAADVTAALNVVCDAVREGDDGFALVAGRRRVRRSTW